MVWIYTNYQLYEHLDNQKVQSIIHLNVIPSVQQQMLSYHNLQPMWDRRKRSLPRILLPRTVACGSHTSGWRWSWTACGYTTGSHWNGTWKDSKWHFIIRPIQCDAGRFYIGLNLYVVYHFKWPLSIIFLRGMGNIVSDLHTYIRPS